MARWGNKAGKILNSQLLNHQFIIITLLAQVIHMLIFIMVVFFLCWTPILTYNLLAAFELMGEVISILVFGYLVFGFAIWYSVGM